METDAFSNRLNNNTAGVPVVLGSPLDRSIRQVSNWVQFDSTGRQKANYVVSNLNLAKYLNSKRHNTAVSLGGNRPVADLLFHP